jgi:hypothetical protein
MPSHVLRVPAVVTSSSSLRCENISWGDAFPGLAASVYVAHAPVQVLSLAAPISGEESSIEVSGDHGGTIMAGSLLLIDGELIRATSVNGTSVTVERGARGTVVQRHMAGGILIGPPLAPPARVSLLF